MRAFLIIWGIFYILSTASCQILTQEVTEQKVFTAPEPRYRLPTTFLPFHYDLRLLIVLDQLPAEYQLEQWTAPGSVTIYGTCVHATTNITLHSEGLRINETSVRVCTCNANFVKITLNRYKTSQWIVPDIKSHIRREYRNNRTWIRRRENILHNYATAANQCWKSILNFHWLCCSNLYGQDGGPLQESLWWSLNRRNQVSPERLYKCVIYLVV